MVRVNLFENAGPGIYGTATYQEILSVCGAATLFCIVMGMIVFGAVQALLALK